MIERTPSKQEGFGLSKKVKKTPVVKKSELPLSKFDREQGLELRTILVAQGSDLVTSGYKTSSSKIKGTKRPKRKYTRAVTPETLAENFYLLRKERGVSEKEIIEVMEFISREANGQFTPKVYNAMDLYNKWERFRDAARRKEGQGKNKFQKKQESIKRNAELGWEIYLKEKERNEKDRIGEEDFAREFSGILW